ncbi:ThiF family adenylyltransferase [Dactylosporangium sp. NPDC051541]|uniref:ThiF family adenylyltransferase n=1 Tax=Dactylosporangium sp. NPDC051541 TaxID=3363977 RepID=UPI003796BAE5
MTDSAIVLITSGSAARITASEQLWGRTTVATDGPGGIIGVVGTSNAHGPMVFDEPAAEQHPIASAAERRPGVWAVTHADVHEVLHKRLARIQGRVPIEGFQRRCIPAVPDDQLRSDGCVVVTRAPQATLEWAVWRLEGGFAAPVDFERLAPADADPIRDLGAHWPVGDLDRRVVLVGAGSIGSAAAHALARYGVRDLVLVDSDRLRSHNVVRHQCGREDIGRHKVDAVRDALVRRWPGLRVEALRRDVIAAADDMRPLFGGAALVLCAADGVAARRTVNHLARRAGRTAVFACVLRDGAVGEVLRTRPWPGAGCLLCVRAMLVEHGAVDPEPALDAGYGRGDSHRPMTAVGSDLALVGEFAAKTAVATLLEEAGHYEHVLRRDWALIGLRLDRTAPEPFDLYPGQVHWRPETGGPIPSRPTCPTCA